MALIECVPNFSEGRDAGVVRQIRDAIAAAPGTAVLDWSADEWHHRSVITFVASANQMVDAAFAGIVAARDLIDIRRHAGVHPRIGAADVVPFIPLAGATMADCIELARSLGERVGRELEIPVYLYGEAASLPHRVLLADVRRGQVEGLRETIAVDASRAPDFGPARVHPSFGAIAIGARPLLLAFNCFLGDVGNLSAVREIARVVRESSGGLPGVRALALAVDGQAQLSMNLVDLERTPVHVVIEIVRREALARGLMITRSELIGLMPESALDAAGAHLLKLPAAVTSRILERRVRERRATTADTPIALFPDDGVRRLLDAAATALDLLTDPDSIAPSIRSPDASVDPGDASHQSPPGPPDDTAARTAYSPHALPAAIATIAHAAANLAETLGNHDGAAHLRAQIAAGGRRHLPPGQG